MSLVPQTLDRIRSYCQRNGLTLLDRLGFGVHGSVFVAENEINGGQSALKAHENERFYLRERRVYSRLKEFAVRHIRNAEVPQLINYDDELWVIEMTIVERPFILDFAGAYLDFPPDYSEQVLAEWRAEKQEQFGPRWPEVQAI